MIVFRASLAIFNTLILLVFFSSSALAEEGLCKRENETNLTQNEPMADLAKLTRVTEEILPCAFADNGELDSRCLDAAFYVLSEKGTLCWIPMLAVELCPESLQESPTRALMSQTSFGPTGASSCFYYVISDPYIDLGLQFPSPNNALSRASERPPTTPD